MNKFNLSKYIKHQNRLYESFEQGKITNDEYRKASTYEKEEIELRNKVNELKKWITKENLPFTIEMTTSNVQLVVRTNNMLLKSLRKKFN